MIIEWLKQQFRNAFYKNDITVKEIDLLIDYLRAHKIECRNGYVYLCIAAQKLGIDKNRLWNLFDWAEKNSVSHGGNPLAGGFRVLQFRGDWLESVTESVGDFSDAESLFYGERDDFVLGIARLILLNLYKSYKINTNAKQTRKTFKISNLKTCWFFNHH